MLYKTVIVLPILALNISVEVNAFNQTSSSLALAIEVRETTLPNPWEAITQQIESVAVSAVASAAVANRCIELIVI